MNDPRQPQPRRPLRILHSESASTFGGEEHRVYKEMLAMRARGHDLELVCQPGAFLIARLRSQGFRVHEVAMSRPGDFIAAALRIARLLGRGRFDVLNTHSRADTLRAAVAGRLTRVPLIVRTRHLAFPPHSLMSYTVLPHRVIAVSEYVRNLLIARGVAAHKVAAILTAINLPEPVERSTVRTELGLPPDSIIIGSVGHMRTQKGHAQLIAAATPLLRANDALHLVIAGRGEPLLSQLRSQVERDGLAQRIHLLGQRDDVVNLLCGFDVFALATQVEALGTSFIEAAACGLPLVGTRVGGVPEIIEDGVNGFLVDPHSPSALTHALARLIADAPLRRAMGQAAKAKVHGDDRFTVDTMARTTEEAYYRWLSERADSHRHHQPRA